MRWESNTEPSWNFPAIRAMSPECLLRMLRIRNWLPGVMIADYINAHFATSRIWAFSPQSDRQPVRSRQEEPIGKWHLWRMYCSLPPAHCMLGRLQLATTLSRMGGNIWKDLSHFPPRLCASVSVHSFVSETVIWKLGERERERVSMMLAWNGELQQSVWMRLVWWVKEWCEFSVAAWTAGQGCGQRRCCERGCSALIRAYQDERKKPGITGPAAHCHAAAQTYTQTYRTLRHIRGRAM